MKDPSARLLYPSLTGVYAWASTSIAVLMMKVLPILNFYFKCKGDLNVDATFE